MAVFRSLVVFFQALALGVTASPASQYNPQIAKTFAALAQASSCGGTDQQSNLLDWSCGPCQRSGIEVVPGSVRLVQHAEASEDNSTFIYVMRFNGAAWSNDVLNGCVVSVRGSKNVANWIKDFDVTGHQLPYDSCDGCKVESGFYSVWTAVEDQVVAALTDVGCVANASSEGTDATPNLWITGHSLGAAISTVAMYTLQKRGYNVEQGFNFESPRVGNQNFADAFDNEFGRGIPFFRITRAEDPVPHLPMESLGYRHVKNEVYYDASGDYQICDGSGEDPACADRYGWFATLSHAGDHCPSSLVSNGNICDCDASGTYENVMV